MILEDELRAIQLPPNIAKYIGDYHKALLKRAEMDLLGETEFRCYQRFVNMATSGKYRFAEKSMARLFKFLSFLVYTDENGKLCRLHLYPIQKFIMCAIFGLRRMDGGYVVNTARVYMARRNGKSFLLSGVLHYIMTMSKFRNELVVLASCKGQNAQICFNEFVKFIDNNPLLQGVYSNINRTACWAKQRETGNRLEMFRTGGQSRRQLDGHTNRVCLVDEECLCDPIIVKTLQDGQAHFTDALMCALSTAQFDLNGENHKRWLALRKALYDGDLPDNQFLLLCEPDPQDLANKDFSDVRVFAKANPVLMFQMDGYTIKDHIRRKYIQKAREAMTSKGFDLQNFVTKQCNVWYSSQEKTICSYDQLIACRSKYSFDDIANLGYNEFYLGVDLSQSLDLSSVAWCCYVGIDENDNVIENGEPCETHKLFAHVVSWLPKNKLQQHINNDKFAYFDYVNKELFLCDGGGGENIDIQQVYDYINNMREKYDLYYRTITVDPYNISGIQTKLSDICGDFILQDQSPKSLSSYIEALSKQFKENGVLYHGGHEDLLEKAITNAMLVRNNSGYYSLEKIALSGTPNSSAAIRIDPLDALLDAFIAAYIDYNNETTSDEAADNYINLFGGV